MPTAARRCRQASAIAEYRGLACKIVQMAERVGVKLTVFNHSTSKKTESCWVNTHLRPPGISSLSRVRFRSGDHGDKNRMAVQPPAERLLLILRAPAVRHLAGIRAGIRSILRFKLS
jgi:hypothetical protein